MATNKIVLITGGSRGLGKNMALAAARKGLDIVITYHSNKEEAQKVVREIQSAGQKAAALQLDTGVVKSFDPFVTELRNILQQQFSADKFDFLVNNAGIGMNAPFAETSEEQFDLLLSIHFKGVFFLTQKLLYVMNDGGGIVNISSGLARFAMPGYSAYGAMKGAIETLTRYQAKELGARGIRVNTIAPGAIETDFGGGHVRDNQQINQFVSSVTALGRAGLPDDIGGVVAFLCSPEAGWVNAQRIEVSGGMLI
ncbi:MAG: SDR family oxidoreductase [Chitinophagaceae bacterium]|nr:SDR family oxidoreductase [Chitinophagaceae bacterium]